MLLKQKSMLTVISYVSVLYFYGLPFQLYYIVLPLFYFFTISNILMLRLQKKIAIFFIYLLSYFLFNVFLQEYLSAQQGSIINFSMCWLSVIMGCYLASSLDLNEVRAISNKVAWVAVMYALIDALWRLMHPDYSQDFEGNPFFYRYKTHSLMFEDSNFVGLMLVCVNGILFSVINNFKEIDKKLVLMLLLSVILTFSRGSILAVIFTYFLYLFLNSSIAFKILTTVLLTLSSSAILSGLYTDGSFRSKFYIIDLFNSFYSNLDFYSKLLGVGLGNTARFIGVGAHNILVVGGLELGILGSALYLLACFLLIFFVGQPMVYLIIPYFFNGFSLTSTSVPVLFLFMGVLLSLKTKRNSYF